jgi:hypothetical protein
MAKKASAKPAPKSAAKKGTASKLLKGGKGKSETKKSTGNADFLSRVGGLEKAWNEARERTDARTGGTKFKNENLGDGHYCAQLLSCKAGAPKDRNKSAYVVNEYRIVFGDCDDETIATYDEVSNKAVGTQGSTKLDMLYNRLKSSGAEISSPSEIPAACANLSKENPYVHLVIKWSDDEEYQYANVYGVITEEDFDTIEAKNSETE